MRKVKQLLAALSPATLLIASCSSAQSGDSPAQAGSSPFAIAEKGSFDSPWALAFAPGTQTLFITEKPGTMKFVDLATGRLGSVTGLPKVLVQGQGGLGDVAFLASESAPTVSRRTIYLTWADPGDGTASFAAMGRGTLVCDPGADCRIEGLTQIWRQQPAIKSAGHYSHKIAFSPDGKYLFLSSGERMQGDPAQDLGTNLGKILRLNLDGTPADGNPFADRGGVSREIWSYGHRNLLGLHFDLDGQLWDLEHGPRGGDEINKVEPGNNYGWPVRSNGDNYDGSPIPDHSANDGFTKPAISWNPVIAPGDFVFYSGKLWPQWRNQAVIANLGSMSIVRVKLADGKGTEEARIKFDKRLRDIVEAADGSLYVIEDGANGRLLQLTPAR
ncbi:PQQ-dependent sugar dehydrogenase [Croceibacterium sp. LX-88]|uniref:PQQ-dependent sugar dehydrogenase n=1 Tax=Croceibacterium selenioxidans TaxID=2838833 RepID=A0ABS5W3E1_9SPHN|nr:PQQ-dependent sugar dehydrogenase [Croceibacterium selenioxidans]MBT2134275.1 PQQ-dependent sugar dehydrogenase [Croceibacterium selenioxidans]